jgi:hypothetical protein
MTKGRLTVVLGLLICAALVPSSSAQPVKCPSGQIPQCSGQLPHLNCFCIPNPTPYLVTGTVTGLAADSGITLSVSSQFATYPVIIGPIKNGPTSFYVGTGTYTISYGALSTQACVITNATGIASPSGSPPFTVTCGKGYTIGGTITGLAPPGLALPFGTLALSTAYTAQTLTLPPAGPFTFSGLVPDGQSYQLSLQISSSYAPLWPGVPYQQTCTVANGTGTIHGANVTNVEVSCSGDTVVCDSAGCLSELSFLNNIVALLTNLGYSPVGPNVVGAVVMVGGLTAAVGPALTSVDGPSGMSVALSQTSQIDVASVSKTLTAAAAINSLTNHGISLTSLIWQYLYSDWTLGPNIKTITFNDLLTHRSGFTPPPSNPNAQPPPDPCGGASTTYSDLESIIAKGVAKNHQSNPEYSNCNFAIFRELLYVIENGFNANNPPPHPYPQRATDSANAYVGYVNQYVFGPVGIPTRTCAPSTNPTIAALAYPIPPGNTAGWNGGMTQDGNNTLTNSAGDWTLACGGGGWNVSAQDLWTVVNDLANGNKILTPAEKTAMFPPGNPGNYLGWDNTVRNDCNPYPCKNGGIPGGGPVQIRTYIGIFKCTVPVILIVNSAIPLPNPEYVNPNGDPIPLVDYAYNSATFSDPRVRVRAGQACSGSPG